MTFLNLPITRYRIHYQAISPICLPSYAGSSLRGAFGHALKSIASTLPATAYSTDEKHVPSVYECLFEPKKIQRSQHDTDPIVPYIIEVPTGAMQLPAGQQHYVDMVLIGEFAHSQLAVIQFAWLKALYGGIGAKNEHGQRGQAQFLSMDVFNQPAITDNPKHATIQIQSFLRLAHHGKLIYPAKLTADIFIHALVRRIHEINRLYAAAPIHHAQPNMAILTDSQLHWKHWTRYSNRQKQDMDLGGLVGHFSLSNISDELWAYLYLGQWLHVGKNCVFGLGQYQCAG